MAIEKISIFTGDSKNVIPVKPRTNETIQDTYTSSKANSKRYDVMPLVTKVCGVKRTQKDIVIHLDENGFPVQEPEYFATLDSLTKEAIMLKLIAVC